MEEEDESVRRMRNIPQLQVLYEQGSFSFTVSFPGHRDQTWTVWTSEEEGGAVESEQRPTPMQAHHRHLCQCLWSNGVWHKQGKRDTTLSKGSVLDRGEKVLAPSL